MQSRLGIIIAFAYAALAIVFTAIVIADADWFEKYESGIASAGHVLLVMAGIFTVPLAIWRSVVAERQATAAQTQSETARSAMLHERYKTGTQMLGNEELWTRVSGIQELARLSEEHPDEYHLRIMRLLSGFVRTKKRGTDKIPSKQEWVLDEPPFDVQAAMDAIGTRTRERLMIENKAYYKPDLRRAQLQRGSLAHANLSNTRLGGAQLQSAALRRADFSYAILNQANLTGATLGGAILHGAELHRSILRSAVLWTPWPPGRLRFISYYDALKQGDVISADLSASGLDHADCLDASMQGVNFSESDLTDSILARTRLAGANFAGANLKRANLSNAMFSCDGRIPATGLTQAQLDMAIAEQGKPPLLQGVKDAETGEQLVWRGEWVGPSE